MGNPMILQSVETKDFIVRAGLCQAVVCTSMTDVAEITARINRECPAGTSSGWVLAERENGKENPEPCSDVAGNFHYLFEC